MAEKMMPEVDVIISSYLDYGRLQKCADSVLASTYPKLRLVIADIASGGTVYASVYSSRPLAYEGIEINDANGKFDRKYANIKKLFYNRHVGVASTWGFY